MDCLLLRRLLLQHLDLFPSVPHRRPRLKTRLVGIPLGSLGARDALAGGGDGRVLAAMEEARAAGAGGGGDLLRGSGTFAKQAAGGGGVRGGGGGLWGSAGGFCGMAAEEGHGGLGIGCLEVCREGFAKFGELEECAVDVWLSWSKKELGSRQRILCCLPETGFREAELGLSSDDVVAGGVVLANLGCNGAGTPAHFIGGLDPESWRRGTRTCQYVVKLSDWNSFCFVCLGKLTVRPCFTRPEIGSLLGRLASFL